MREQYEARDKRLADAIALKKPDRVPVAPLVTQYYATQVAGISNKDAAQDYRRSCVALKEATLRHGFDTALSSFGTLLPSKIAELLGLRQFKWPGGTLRDDQPFQFIGGETLPASEYEDFLADPDAYTRDKIWPRISESLALLSQFPVPPTHWLSGAYDLAFVLPNLLSAPPVLDSLKCLVAVGEEQQRMTTAKAQYVEEMTRLGYPFSFTGVALTAFDWIGDFFRDMRGVMMDMFRQPDQLLETIELLIPATVAKAITSAQRGGNSRVFIPLHWGGGSFMSNDQYARFYWPSLKALVDGLLEAGMTPVPLFEGDYTPRLEFLQEFPRGKVAGHFDVVDRRRAKAAIGDTMCFWGNVPASLLVTGTPAEVRDNVRELIEVFGDTGGLIVDANLGLPDEARPENVAAMVEAVFEFGVH